MRLLTTPAARAVLAMSFAANLALPSPAAAKDDDGFEGIIINLWDLDAAGHYPLEGYAIALGCLVGVQLLVYISCLAHELFTFLAHSNFSLATLNGLGERLLPSNARWAVRMVSTGVALAVGCVALFIGSL